MPSNLAIPLALAVTLAAVPALAGPLILTTELRVEHRVAAADGTTRMALTRAVSAAPGERVVVVLTYRNTGAQPLSNVVLANPLPKGILYRAANPGSPAPDLSVDGKTYGALAALRAPAAGGGTRPAGPDDVTAVRWRLTSPVVAGSQGELAFQGVIK